MEAENAPPLGIVIAFWAFLIGTVCLACAPVIMVLAIILGAR